MILYAQERLADIQSEIEALVPDQWAEMAQGFTTEPEKPQWDFYFALEKQNRTLLLTARENGRLIGYFGVFLYNVEGQIAVRSAPYYVVPLGAMRRALILRKLVRLIVEKLAKTGYRVLIKTHPWASIGPILEHEGFRAVETWYMLEKPASRPEAPDA